MRTGFFNVWVLALSNALSFSATPLMMFIGSLIGAEMAPSANWATLPIALMVVGTALGVMPATQLMRRYGRKTGLYLFLALGTFACWMAGEGIAADSFVLFCAASALLGATNAALQQMRFAAMECVELDKSATAASIVMCGGIGAAIIGPELAVAGRELTAIEYQGSFWLVALCFCGAGVVLGLFSPAQQPVGKKGQQTRALSEIVKNPAFCLAVASGAVAYVVMTFIMTGTPISMHNHHGHSLIDTKWVIQCHIAAMFMPSLVAPWLFRLLAIRGMMVAGLGCYGLTVLVGCFDTSVNGFWLQLVLLGIGWNFLFVAGTALLPSTYQEGEQFKAQAFNDGLVFSIQAAASLTAGLAINSASWQTILLLSLLPLGLMIYMLAKDRSVPVPAA